MISGPGIDGAKVKTALIKLGAKPGTVAGRAGIVWGAEDSSDVNAANQYGIGPAEGQFDRAVIEAHRVIAGRYAVDAQRLLGTGGRTLGAEPVVQATLNCLGDPVAALGVAGQGQATGSELAVGVLRRSGGPQEVLCEVPSAAGFAAAEKLVRSLYSAQPPPLPQGTNLRAQASSVTIGTGSSGGRRWVRAIVVDKPSIDAGVLINAVGHNVLQP